MNLCLPPKTNKLINAYLNLRVGHHTVVCPYFQNIVGRKGNAVYTGKGLPKEIEKETIRLFNKRGKNLDKLKPTIIRQYMVMAGLGIDCSGFVTRVLNTLMNESKLGNIKSNLKPLNNNLFNIIRFQLRPFSNVSAKMLTSPANSSNISNINKVSPGDLIKAGEGHVAIITEVQKDKKRVHKITYHHSTSDYLHKHGVRKGSIVINKPTLPLEKNKWTEIYQGRNWMLEDYLKAKKENRGLRRLKTLYNN